MNPARLARLARFTRRYLGEKRPLSYRLCKAWLGLVYPRHGRRDSHRLVIEHDRGLIHVDTASSIEYAVLFRGVWEPEVARLLDRLVRPGDVCLDVGASVGVHALRMAFRVGAGGRVIACEPQPELAERSRANAALNRLANLTVVEAAVAERDGTATFYTYREGEFARALSGLTPAKGAERAIEVRTASGAGLARELGLDRLDLVKIDAEGADAAVISTLDALIEKHRPTILFEHREQHWSRLRASIDGVVTRLRALGYRLYVIADDATAPLDGAVPPSCELLAIAGRA